MSNNATFEAFSLWKNLYEQTESAWRETIEKTLEQKSFAEGLGQFQSQYLQYQGLVNGMTESYLKQLNIPTRDEIASVATLIVNVETKVDELEEQLDEVTASNTKEIDQIKKSITKLDKKLDEVTSLLKGFIATQAGPVVPSPTAAPKPEPTATQQAKK